MIEKNIIDNSEVLKTLTGACGKFSAVFWKLKNAFKIKYFEKKTTLLFVDTYTLPPKPV